MKQINVPAINGLSSESQVILEQVQKGTGKVPNLYAIIGYSGPALKAMMDFERDLLSAHSFTAKEKEAISLMVSQVNDCEYCLAAHTALAQMRGFTNEDIISIRKGEYTDKKLNAVLLLARSIASNKGKGDSAMLNSFFEAGYNETALIELIALITARIFTNYVFANSNIPIDFPAAAQL